MAVAGIDVGSQSTKVVILEGDRILAAVTLQSGESGESEARQAMEEALRQARRKLEDVKSVVSTGTGRMSVPFARKQQSAVSCLARGARFLYPQARTVLNAGAESSTAIRLSADSPVCKVTAARIRSPSRITTLVDCDPISIPAAGMFLPVLFSGQGASVTPPWPHGHGNGPGQGSRTAVQDWSGLYSIKRVA